MPTNMKRIGLEIQEAEYASWEAKAKALGLSMQGLIREAVRVLPVPRAK